MGSYDKMPKGWEESTDEPWLPQHAIGCRSKWSGADRTREGSNGLHWHETTDVVRSCQQAGADEARGIEVWPCGWLLEGRYDDGSVFTYPCPMPMRVTGPGRVECDGGHEHVDAQQRYNEGWDYADEDEADGLVRAGTRPVDMQGRPLR